MTDDASAFKKLFLERNRELAIHELDTIFGVGNPITQRFMAGTLEASTLLRGLLRQQYFNTLRLRRIEDRLGIKFDPKDPG